MLMTGKPQTLSRGQEDHVVEILRKKLLFWILTGFAILAGFTGLSLWGIMQRTQGHVEALVAKQFEEPNIQTLVREVASERSESLMSEQVGPEVKRFKSEIAQQLSNLTSLVERTRELEAKSQQHETSIQDVLTTLKTRLADVDTQLSDAQEATLQLTEIGDFMLLAIKAIGDDAVAFDELLAISLNPTNRFTIAARGIVLGIQAPLSGPTPPPFALVPDEIVKQVSVMPGDSIKAITLQLPSVMHAHLAHMVWNSTNFSKHEKLDFLAFVLDKSDSITARATAGKHFATESGRWYGQLQKEEWLQWWGSNSSIIADSDISTK